MAAHQAHKQRSAATLGSESPAAILPPSSLVSKLHLFLFQPRHHLYCTQHCNDLLFHPRSLILLALVCPHPRRDILHQLFERPFVTRTAQQQPLRRSFEKCHPWICRSFQSGFSTPANLFLSASMTQSTVTCD